MPGIVRGFNPHTHTGCDLAHSSRLGFFTCFNPHTHTGCDWASSRQALRWIVSIHTPIQGVTKMCFLAVAFVAVSIHTPIQGVTQHLGYLLLLALVSIHTPIQGVTVKRNTWCVLAVCFNPHTHTGCDTSRPASLLMW